MMMMHACINRKKCDNELKKKLMTELHDLVRGNIKQVSLTLLSETKHHVWC